jgi:catechol 2,3-dioxygenase-like lactoylglutathione lyase family enzyme
VSRTPHPYVGGHLVVVIDCGDLDRSAEFWTGVLGYARAGPPGGRYQGLVPASGQGIEIHVSGMLGVRARRLPGTFVPGPAAPKDPCSVHDHRRPQRQAGSQVSKVQAVPELVG